MNIEQTPKPANDNEPKKIWSRSDAIAEIGLLRQQAMQEGAVDSEHSDLSRLIIDIRNNTITAEEAVEKARALIKSRQSYN